MKFNGFLHVFFNFSPGFARRNTAGKIRRIGGETGGGRLKDNQVSTHFRPACFKILFWVLGKIIVEVSGNCDQSGFGGMFELPMAPPGADKIPSIVLDQFEDVPDFHSVFAGQDFLGVFEKVDAYRGRRSKTPYLFSLDAKFPKKAEA